MTPEAKLILFKKKVIKLGCKKEKLLSKKTIKGPLAHFRGRRKEKEIEIKERKRQ